MNDPDHKQVVTPEPQPGPRQNKRKAGKGKNREPEEAKQGKREKCNQCGVWLSNRYNLKRHKSKVHSKASQQMLPLENKTTPLGGWRRGGNRLALPRRL